MGGPATTMTSRQSLAPRGGGERGMLARAYGNLSAPQIQSFELSLLLILASPY